MAFLAVLTATYKQFLVIFFLILIHEIGHSLMALLFHVRVEKIIIYPLGGISKFDMDLNISPYKELWILIMGPIFQFLGYYILILLFGSNYLFDLYHYTILIFNLLPIYPLDGGKLLKIFFDFYLPYKYSFYLVIITSFLIVFITLIKTETIYINSIIIGGFLLVLIYKERKKIPLFYNKFLLERILNNYNFKNIKIINDKNSFYRNKKHLIKNKGVFISEKDYLEDLFKKKH